jgi:hypothetical protein
MPTISSVSKNSKRIDYGKIPLASFGGFGGNSCAMSSNRSIKSKQLKACAAPDLSSIRMT